MNLNIGYTVKLSYNNLGIGRFGSLEQLFVIMVEIYVLKEPFNGQELASLFIRYRREYVTAEFDCIRKLKLMKI